MNHQWDVSPAEARKIQSEIQHLLVQKPLPKKIRFIAGADISFNRYEKDMYAAIIILTYPELKMVEYSCCKMEVDFPYIPGLLSFREIPPLLRAWKGIVTRPDVIMVDGHGIAHPKRLGIAAHFGLAIDMPTMGCAKHILYGTYEEPAKEAGSFSYIIDPKTQEQIGVTLRTKDNVKPVFISSGNLCTLPDAIRIAKEMSRGYRLPEPTRMTHDLVNAFRKGELKADHWLSE